MQEAQLLPVFYRADQFWMYMVWVITGALPVGLLWEGVWGQEREIAEDALNVMRELWKSDAVQFQQRPMGLR